MIKVVESHENQLLTINEVCQILKISRNTYYRINDPKYSRYDPEFPQPIDIGIGKRFYRRDIDAYIRKAS